MSAKIIDFGKIMELRFWEWANEWLDIPADEQFDIDFIIAFLIANEVFTLEEIRAELNNRKIVIHERVFESATMLADDLGQRVAKMK